MSLGSDWIADHIFDPEAERISIDREACEGIWRTKDGREIPVQMMTTNHIKNTIAYLKRIDCIDMYAPWIITFQEELERRGEMNG